MKVLVTGAGGLLGHDVWHLFRDTHDLRAIGREQPLWVPTAQWDVCDLTDAARTYAVITRFNPEVVVHCAAYNNVDGAEADPAAAYQGNMAATRNVALACQRFDTVLMAISTDYVFSGDDAPEGGYREFDTPRPMGRYAESKRWAEIAVEQLLSKFYIVRTSWLFGPSRPTWVDRVVEAARDQKTITAVTDMVSSPTYTPDLAAALLQLAESGRFGTYHLTNSGACSRVQFAERVLELNRLPATSLRRVSQKELALPAPRPRFSALRNLAWEVNGYRPLRSWDKALEEYFSKAKVKL